MSSLRTDRCEVEAQIVHAGNRKRSSLPVVVTVRRAVPKDARAIAEIHVRAWQVAYRGLLPDELLDGLSVAQRERFWREASAGGQQAGPVLVAAADTGLVGFCAVATPSRDDDADAGVAEIGAIYVDPAAWRSGVGRALMGAAISQLRVDGWRSVTLWVLAENVQAREFYARLGFEPDGGEMRHAGSGQNEIRLRAPLEPPAAEEAAQS